MGGVNVEGEGWAGSVWRLEGVGGINMDDSGQWAGSAQVQQVEVISGQLTWVRVRSGHQRAA